MCEFVSSTLIKMKLCLILVCAALQYTEAKIQHKEIYINLCSDTEKETIYGLDGEEKWHADFSQGKGVMTLPQFADRYYYADVVYEMAVTAQAACKQNLDVCIKSYKYPEEPKAHIGVSWTKNNVNVTSEATLSRYYVTDDGTFNLISHLSFTPEEDDIYTCTADHAALDKPLTKTWDVQVALPGVGPSVFCGVGLAAGLLGVAAGTFFIIKGNNCN
ncbi:hypothetical protein SRHO_G00328520 [Serrasalmus rhombeus]